MKEKKKDKNNNTQVFVVVVVGWSVNINSVRNNIRGQQKFLRGLHWKAIYKMLLLMFVFLLVSL